METLLAVGIPGAVAWPLSVTLGALTSVLHHEYNYECLSTKNTIIGSLLMVIPAMLLIGRSASRSKRGFLPLLSALELGIGFWLLITSPGLIYGRVIIGNLTCKTMAEFWKWLLW